MKNVHALYSTHDREICDAQVAFFVLALVFSEQFSAACCAGFTIQLTPDAVTRSRIGFADPNDPTATVESGLNQPGLEHLGSATNAAKNALASTFPGNQFNYAAGSLNGTLSVSNYSAYLQADGAGGGATLIASYTPGMGDPVNASLRWIQVIYSANTNNGTPYVDTSTGNPAQNLSGPFYYNSDQQTEQHPNGTTSFSDQPFRSMPAFPPGSSAISTYWLAELYLTSWTGAGPITVYDGVGWGFDLNHVRAEVAVVGSAVPEPNSLILILTSGPARTFR